MQTVRSSDPRFSIWGFLGAVVAIDVAWFALARRLSLPGGADQLGLQVAFLAWSVFFVWRRRVDVPRLYAAPPRRSLWRWCALIVAYVASLLLAGVLVALSDAGDTALKTLDVHPSRLSDLAMVLVGMLSAPVVEELAFRGLLLPNLMHRVAPRAAVLGSAALFALVHLEPTMLIQFGAGILFAVAYLETRSLWVSMAMHLTNNALVVLPPLLFKAQFEGPDAAPSAFTLPVWVAALGVSAIVVAWVVVLYRVTLRVKSVRAERGSAQPVAA